MTTLDKFNARMDSLLEDLNSQEKALNEFKESLENTQHEWYQRDLASLQSAYINTKKRIAMQKRLLHELRESINNE